MNNLALNKEVKPEIQFCFYDRFSNPTRVDLFVPGQPWDAHEFTKIDITITAPEHSEIFLLLGDYEIKLRYNNGQYHAKKISPFVNTLGTTCFNLDVSGKNIESRAVNVFCSKLTYDKAVQFLRYLSVETPEIAQLCFSTSKLGSDGKNSNLDIITRKLEAGLKVLTYLTKHAERFKRDPIYVNEASSEVENYHKHTTIDADSIAYLATHPDQLLKSDSYHCDLVLEGRHYEINNIAKRTARKNLDIYENRVILSFIENFYYFLQEARKNLEAGAKTGQEIIVNNGDSYFSFDRMLKDSGLILSMHSKKIEKGIQICSQLLKLFRQLLPCTLLNTETYKPRPSPKVLAKAHYKDTYGFLKHYYFAEEPEWSGSMDFFGLRNLSKVYEMVCLFRLIRSLINQGCRLNAVDYIEIKNSEVVSRTNNRPVNEPYNYYNFKIGDKLIEFYYEPRIPLYRSSLSTNSFRLVDVVNYRVGRTWMPDFLIRILDDGVSSYHILDAKYSTEVLVNETNGHLDKCIRKYVNGIKILGEDDSTLSRNVDSMHILYSAETKKGYHSVYSNNLSLIDGSGYSRDAAARPFLGSFQLSTIDSITLDEITRHILF
jgi:hypothetical protein